MKKIIIPVDFSEVTENALVVATEIARKTHAEVELLHVIEAPYEADFTVSADTSLPGDMHDLFILKSIEVARKNIGKIVNNVKYAGVRFHSRIKIGSPYKQITNHIVKEAGDLIIMGTGGTNSLLQDLFNSSNTGKVVTHANCMVLAVKKNNTDFRIRNIVFATDFKDDSPEFIEKLNALQEIFDFKLHILYINSVENPKSDESLAKTEQKMKDFVRLNKIRNYEFKIFDDLSVYAGITDYAEAINADLIALSTHQRKGLHWLGSISQDLVNHAEKPVLTYKVNG